MTVINPCWRQEIRRKKQRASCELQRIVNVVVVVPIVITDDDPTHLESEAPRKTVSKVTPRTINIGDAAAKFSYCLILLESLG